MRKRKPSPVHLQRKVTISLMRLTPIQNYMEEELSMDEVSEKLIDCKGEQFFLLFKQYNQRFFKHGTFHNTYFFESYFSPMFLFFNDRFYETYQLNCFYALPSSFAGLSTYLLKEQYPNETEYLKTVAYLDNQMNFKEGSLLLELMF